jgi:hypothetical protein
MELQQACFTKEPIPDVVENTVAEAFKRVARLGTDNEDLEPRNVLLIRVLNGPTSRP